MDDWSIWGSITKLLKARWKLIALMGLLGGVLGIATAIVNPVVCTAKAEVVIGNYALPPEIATNSAVDKTGPLGLELPAETQALIISSPSIAADAAAKLGLSQDESSALAARTSAAPTTDNSYSVGAEGETAETAVRNANAVATAFLEYRAETGRDELLRLADEAQAKATEHLEAAVALDAPINAALKDGNNTYAAALLTHRQELEGLASTASTSSTTLEAAAASFTGGGELLRPAISDNVASSFSVAELAALGCLLGLAAGCALVAIRRQVGNRVLDDTDVTRSTGVRTVVEVGVGPTQEAAGQLFVRSIAPRSDESDRTPHTILVRPVSSGPGIAPGLALLTSGMMAQGRAFVALALDPVAAAEMQHLQDHTSAEAVRLITMSDSARTDAESAVGVSADLALASSESLVAPEFVLLISGTAEDASQHGGVIPRTFTGSVVLLARKDKDTVQALSRITRQLANARVSVEGVVLLSSEKPTFYSRHKARLVSGQATDHQAASGWRGRRRRARTQISARALSTK